MRFDIDTTVLPVTEPVTLAEVKAKLLITDTDNDTRLTALISAVRNNVENFCGIAIGSQTKQWVYDFDYDTHYSIPYGPVISITSINQNTSGNTYELLTANSDYYIDGGTVSGLYGVNKMIYVTGMTTIPAALKEGILTEIAYRYENYGDENKDGFSKEAMNYIIKYKDFSWE